MTAFAILPTIILQDHALTVAEFRVLGALFSFRRSSSDWRVWPSRESIGARCGITHVDSISRITRRLVKRGYVSITRRQSSSIYHLSIPQDPAQPLLDVRSDLTPGCQMNETKEENTNTPLTPASGGSEIAVTKTQLPTPTPQLSVNVPQEPVTQLPNPTPTVAAAQELVAHLNAVTGSNLPTDPHASIVRRVTRRLKTFAPQDIKDAITHGANVFRIPAAMLKPSILESLISQAKAEAERHSAKIAQERALIESLKPPPATPESRQVATSALAAMRRMLR